MPHAHMPNSPKAITEEKYTTNSVSPSKKVTRRKKRKRKISRKVIAKQ